MKKFYILFSFLFYSLNLHAAELIGVRVQNDPFKLIATLVVKESDSSVVLNTKMHFIGSSNAPVKFPSNEIDLTLDFVFIELIEVEIPIDLKLAKLNPGQYTVSFETTIGNNFSTTSSTIPAKINVTKNGTSFLESFEDVREEEIQIVKSEPIGGGLGSPDVVVPQAPPIPIPVLSEIEKLQVELERIQARGERGENPLERLSNDNNILVYFATNRQLLGTVDKEKPWRTFEPGSGPITPSDTIRLGAAIVTQSGNRKIGQIEPLKMSGLIGSFNLSKYKDTENKAADFFINQIWGDDILIFIHGYNTGFEDTMIQAAQLKVDLDFKGPVIVISWPSSASPLGYFTDKVNAEKSIPSIANFFDLILRGNENPKNNLVGPRGKIHVIAHSMGNWLFLNSIGFLNAHRMFYTNSFDKVILASPDVSKTSLQQWGPVIAAGAENVSLYYSSEDTALDISSFIHRGNRAGLDFTYVPGIDAIDVDNVNDRWVRLGHSAYSSSERVLQDIRLTINKNFKVWERQPFLKRMKYRDYSIEEFSNWEFTP